MADSNPSKAKKRNFISRLKPWLGGIALLILCLSFYHIQQKHHLNFSLPKGWQGLLFFICLPLIPLCKVFAWKQMTSATGIDIGLSKTMEACILSIAGRYIPGKVLFVIGRVGSYGPQKERLTLASFSMLMEFLVENMAGATLLLAALALGVITEAPLVWPMAGATIIILPALVSSLAPSLLPRILAKLPQKYRPKDMQKFNILSLIWGPWCLTLLHWGLYLFAIKILLQPTIDLSPHQLIGIGASLGFASTAGTLAIFTPGGLGVRESLATLFITAMGIPPELGFSLAMGARCCQWGGEISLTLIYLFFHHTLSKIKNKK